MGHPLRSFSPGFPGSSGRRSKPSWMQRRPALVVSLETPSMIILETARLLFRHHEEADLDAYCEMMADPEFRRLSGGLPLPREEAEKSFRNVLVPKPGAPRGGGLLAAGFKPGGRYIGRSGPYPHPGDRNVVIPGE